MQKEIKIDGLMSIYDGTNKNYLEKTLASIYQQNQVTIRLIIVIDGAISDQVLQSLELWADRIPIKLVKVDANVGLGKALNIGLKLIRTKYFLRFDDDDTSHVDRAIKQYRFMMKNPKLSASSSHINYVNEDGIVIGSRRVATKTIDLLRRSKIMSPLNHPAAILKTEDIITVGGYPEFRKGQDYALWAKLLNSNYKLSNCDEYLVNMGTPRGSSRRGLEFLFFEKKVIKYIYKIGYTNKVQYMIAVGARIIKRTTNSIINVNTKSWFK